MFGSNYIDILYYMTHGWQVNSLIYAFSLEYILYAKYNALFV